MLPDESADSGFSVRRGSHASRMAASFPFAFLVIFVVALAARLIYLAEVHSSPDFNSIVLDAQWYHVEAMRIAAEGWMPREALFRAPGFPYLLAAIHRLSGNSLMVARVVQIILGSLAAGLVLTLGWKVYGRWVGWIGGMLAATYGVFIYFSAEILGTALVVLTSLLSLVLLVRAEEKGGWRSWLLAGFALGLSAIVRPTILIFGILSLLWAKGWGSWRSGWGRAAAVAVGIAVWVVPVTIINYHASGEFVFIAHQGGVNYYIGNNPQSDGKTARGPGVKDADLLRSVGKTRDTVYLGAKAAAEKMTGREFKPSEVSGFWSKQALRFMARHPGDWAHLQVRKLYYFWNSYEIGNNRDIGAFLRANSRSLGFPHPGFWLIGPLGLVGLALSLRRGRASRLIALFVVAQMVAVVAFFVCERFRMPAAMALAVLSALAVVSMARALRQRNWRQLTALVLGVAVFCWFANTRAMGISRDQDVPVHLFNQASAYMDQGLYDRAIDTFRQVLRIDPNDAKTYLSMGSAYLAKGLYDQAMESYGRATALEPSLNATVHNDLGVYFIIRNELHRAEEELATALEVDPGYGLAGLNLAYVYRSTGRSALAVEWYRRILEMSDVHPEQMSVAQAEIAMSIAREGRLEEALDLLRRALRFDRTNETARLYLGEILAQSGDLKGAIRELETLAGAAQNEEIRSQASARLAEIRG
ncbi:MAG: tetratricopeptide repeat protein [Candidatus Eisenbacteria sp.]|nr:tetratricopeptide repeat protein [Candidatus Eisenbacteria bacterium]